MEVDGKSYRTIWIDNQNSRVIKIIDQRKLPHEFVIENIYSVDEMAIAIKEMHVRGAGLIGVAGSHGMYLGAIEAEGVRDFESYINYCAKKLIDTRPTAINLEWAVNRQLEAMKLEQKIENKVYASRVMAEMTANDDAQACWNIGKHGLSIIEGLDKKDNYFHVMTHCNAGELAFVEEGTATAPIYAAHGKGIPIHVWVSETRPMNQGSRLTAWEMEQRGIPYDVIADNEAGHLMQRGDVDMVIVGADRVASNGDVANKIGTYMKAQVAKANDVPFYVAFPSSTFDWSIESGKEIPIETRSGNEIKYIQGLNKKGKLENVLLTPNNAHGVNYGFDVTPANLITGLITERGICNADRESILGLYPERR